MHSISTRFNPYFGKQDSKNACIMMSEYTQLSLDHLEEIVHTMTHLEQLDVFNNSIKYSLSHCERSNYFKKLLNVTTASVKNLTLKFDWNEGETCFDYFTLIEDVWYDIVLKKSLRNNYPLPSIINLLISNQIFSIYGSFPVSSYTMASLEIGLYDISRVPMDIYPSIPLRKFQQQNVLLLNSVIMVYWA